ncbi:3-hydroxyacyl-CoA dehydrogenase [Pseudomonas sp. BJa5]|uniref:3-hydroxyacyl-CoA dehydrogenase n=1 Tax=Pseudomonas sp. BJa5 TaxID=2936270 RepID=UPI00255980C2|nr:3-hydroxyacyl-CoA dehydrogenase [Pseudomonas sp. BGr12]MDL2423337.1 3-hydroxyacyl-CoA dehydrogenase [Pseudomonas sp. BGr12]
MSAREIRRMAVVGAGVMGAGIAQIAAQAGVSVQLFDNRPGAAQAARDSILATLEKLAGKGKLSEQQVQAAGDNLIAAGSLAELADAQLVVEAIVENLAIKRVLLADLEAVVADDCLLASNTSSLSVTAIAAQCRVPGRVGGFHFFNPVPLMKIVEVIDGLKSEAWVGPTLLALGERMGHTAVRAQDTPGFIVNHGGRGYGTEAMRVLSESVTDPLTLDRILREQAGFRMGPCELFDLTGLDVSHPVTESIYDQYYQEPRYRPTLITGQRLQAGLLGRKSGQGFYRYVDGVQQVPVEAPSPCVALPTVWVSNARPQAREAVVERLERLGARVDTAPRPGPESLCLVLPLGTDATHAAIAEGLDPLRTLALDTLLPLTRRRVLMTTTVTSPGWSDAAHALLAADGTPVSVIRDSGGFVAQRVLAHIVNIACDMAQQGVASPRDIDSAIRLGLGYPLGPLAWGDALGADTLLQILDRLHDFYRDPRYRPSPWLMRRARLGLSLLASDS